MVKYILELNADEHEARELLLDNGIPEDEINEQVIEETINNLNDMTVDTFYYEFPKLIGSKGFKVGYGKPGYWMILTRGDNLLITEVMVDYTDMNDLEITVDYSKSQLDWYGEVHKVLLELTAKKLN